MNQGRAKRLHVSPAAEGGVQKKRVMGWLIQSAMVLTVAHGDRALQVSCAQLQGTTTWAVLALEGPREDAPTVNENLKNVLGNHRHEVVGHAQGLKAAMEMAEKYANRWQRSQPKEERCDCQDIHPVNLEGYVLGKESV